MGKDIFISYAREDVDTAQRLSLDLRRRGHRPWLDAHNLQGGTEWEKGISRAIERSDFVLILISSKSVNKESYFQEEIRRALTVQQESRLGRIYLIPVRLDSTKSTHKDLEKLNWVNLFPSYVEGFKQLAASLEYASEETSAGLSAQTGLPRRRPPAHLFPSGSVKRCIDQGDFDGAVAKYSRLIDQDEEMFTLYLGRAKAHFYAGRVEEALLDLSEAEKLDPDGQLTRQTREELLHGKGPSLTRIKRRQKDWFLNSLSRGNAALVAGDLKSASRYYEKAKAEGVGEATYIICLVMLHILEQNAHAARDILEGLQHSSLAPHVRVQITALEAITAVSEGGKLELSELMAERSKCSSFDLYKTSLIYLKAALENQGIASSEMMRVFDLLRYGS